MHNDGRWPGHPRLLPEESFSSWFARTAAANGLRPADLFRIVQPDGLRVASDLDRYADLPFIDLMAEHTGQDRDALVQATFRCWAGMAFAQDDGLTKFVWLPPAGPQGGNRCFGQQLCPSCLQGDHQPYLRLPWRLSFLTVCSVHGRLLLDRCPSCNEPFSILRNKHSRDRKSVV